VPQSWVAREAAATGGANQLLAGLAFPSGAVSSSTEPAGDGGRLAIPPARPEFAGLVEQHGWWETAGTPLAVLDYIHEHSAELAGVGGWFPNVTETGAEFASLRLSEGAGVIGERWLRLTGVAVSDGSIVVRIDAEVLWLLPRDPIPSGARLLRISVRRVRPGHAHPRVVNIRSASRVARVVSLVNSLSGGVRIGSPRLLPQAIGITVGGRRCVDRGMRRRRSHDPERAAAARSSGR
jgi:hypothetical protein